MNVNYDLKHPKKYFLVTIVLACGESVRGICHSWNPSGAIRTVMSAPSAQKVINGRDVADVIAEPLDEFESIQKEDFSVQTSKDGLHWIITNVADNIVYKLLKAPRNALSLNTLSFLNEEPLTAQEKHIYRRKLLIWVAKYGKETMSGTLI